MMELVLKGYSFFYDFFFDCFIEEKSEMTNTSNSILADYISRSEYNYIYPIGTLPSNLFFQKVKPNPYWFFYNQYGTDVDGSEVILKTGLTKNHRFSTLMNVVHEETEKNEEQGEYQDSNFSLEKKNSFNRNTMSNIELTPQNLAKSANEYAPLFVKESLDDWDTLCQLVATELGQIYKRDLDKIRVFVLKSNTGTNDESEAVYFPVVSKNTSEGVKDKEASTSRPELAMAQLQDMEDVIEKVSRGSGSYRVSSSTGVSTIYGTSGINKGYMGTTQFILKLAIKDN